MKYHFPMLLFFLIFCLTGSVHSESMIDENQCLSVEAPGCQKLYLAPEQIILSQGGIFVLLEENVYVPVEAVFYDVDGFFILNPPVCGRTCQNGHPSFCTQCSGCTLYHCRYKCPHRNYPHP